MLHETNDIYLDFLSYESYVINVKTTKYKFQVTKFYCDQKI